jgi:REP element-mobilizing transposase RayT
MEYPVMSVQRSILDIAYCLRYAFTCWLNQDVAPQLVQAVFQETQESLERSNLRVLRTRFVNGQVQMLLSCRPEHSASEVARLAKLRLAYYFSQHEVRSVIRRRFTLRAVGENTSKDLEHYLQLQVERRGYVDERFSASLSQYTRDFGYDLSQSFSTNHGQYWNDIHLVVSAQDQYCVTHSQIWDELVGLAEDWFAVNGHILNSFSLLPDHLHLLIRPDVSVSPYDVGAGLISQLNSLRSMPNIYRPKFYVGTHGVYSMTAIRNKGSS